MRSRLGGLARDLAAGAAGTALMSLFEPLEWRLLGRRPLYVPATIVGQLMRRWGRRPPDAATARRMGLALRWAYGPVIGALAAPVLRRMEHRSVLQRGLALGAAVLILELLAFPALGAAPPPRRWPPGDRAMLPAHTAMYGLGTAWALAAL